MWNCNLQILFYYNVVHFRVQILNLIKDLNNDPSVHGILVQMPLDCDNAVDSNLITDAVSPNKDVDGYVFS